MDLTQTELIQVGLDTIDVDTPALPAGLGAQVLDVAAAHRPPVVDDAWATNERHPRTSLSAFMCTAAELSELLDTLEPREWELPTAVQGSSVRELVLHLVGVERYVLGQLGKRPTLEAPTREDHYPVSRGASADLSDAEGADVARAWWQDALRVIAACAELAPTDPVTFHHLAGSVRGLMVVRTFELWTHDDDIRRATSRPLNLLDDDRLTLMSSTLMDLLPHGMALSDTARPGRTARFELTGFGAGSFDVALAPGETPGTPDVIIRTSALELCQLAADRRSIPELEVDVLDGDRSLLEPVLVGAGAFALD